MNRTVKDIAEELHVSKQTIHRTIQKRNIVTIADGNKVLLDDTAYKAIKEEIESKTIQGGRSADGTGTIQDDTRNDTERNTDDAADDLRTEYIESLKAQIEDLKADKQFLQDRLAAAEHDRDVLTKERQTILAELLELKQPKEIELKAPAEPTTAAATKRPAQRHRSERQQPKQGFFERYFGSLWNRFSKRS